MSTENTNFDAATEDNLDDFAATLFGGSEESPSDDATSEEVETEPEVDDDAPETEEDTHSAEDGAPEDEESEENPDETDEDEEAPKKPNRFQERINELTAARREAERKNEELERKLNAVLERLEKEDPKTAPKQEKTEQTQSAALKEPDPDAENEDGSLKYPLGKIDPAFIKDTVQFMLDQREAEAKAQQAEIERQQQIAAQRAPLQQAWNEKLVDAQERYPDFQEKGEQMLSVFEGIDEDYGQYLTDTIMELDAGPDVFYYLANNLDEAKRIVDAGPRKATIALAKIEAQLSEENKPKGPVVKTTKAPPPPPRVKGSAVGKASVSLETDDLDAFSKELFRKR